VLLWHGRSKPLAGTLVVPAYHQLAGRHAVGMDGLEPAEMPPMLGDGRIAEEGLE
jgi:hypothetical protein